MRNLPIVLLNIDRSFVMNSDCDEKDEQVVRMVVTLAQKLGLDIVAEGVESEKQGELLKSEGCAFCQGHYYAKAQPAEHVELMLRDNKGIASGPAEQRLPLDVVV